MMGGVSSVREKKNLWNVRGLGGGFRPNSCTEMGPSGRIRG
jgi:hypothetical protein